MAARYLFRCPLCRSWRLHLYNLAPFVFVCRCCLGLRYRSQYAGRRLDASRERIEEARLALERAEADIRRQRKKEADRRARRAASARLRRQQATWRARRKRLETAERAYEWRQSEAEMRELARVVAWCDVQRARAQRLAARAGLDDKNEVA